VIECGENIPLAKREHLFFIDLGSYYHVPQVLGMWESSWEPHLTFDLVKTPLDFSGGCMGLVIVFVGLCWGSTPTRKSNLRLNCGGDSMMILNDCI
jgi:hypothetical protein